jgi:hypothetical protein
MTHQHFARFFRSVPGHIVSRYGTATKGTNNQRIGCAKISKELPNRSDLIGEMAQDSHLVWTDEIVPITHAEAKAFGREYDGHVADEALEEVTLEDFEAFLKAGGVAKVVRSTLETDAPPSDIP